MEPLLPAETEVMEREADTDQARRKIQFSVPSAVPTQLDPRQVEMIRRRRPTPATLFRLTDNPSPEEEINPHQWVLGDNGALKAKLVHTSTYQPPSLKAVQSMALAHFSSLDMSSVDKDESSSEEEEEGEQSQHTASDLTEESESADLSRSQREEEEAKKGDRGKGDRKKKVAEVETVPMRNRLA